MRDRQLVTIDYRTTLEHPLPWDDFFEGTVRRCQGEKRTWLHPIYIP